MSMPATAGNILVVRLGAMGDIVHALPAVAWLKRGFPRAHLAWLVEAKWAALLDGNPFVDERIELDRQNWRGAVALWRNLRLREFALAADFQGLFKSALPAAASGAARVFGFASPRERPAGVLYSHRVVTAAAHVVDRNLDLARAAGAQPGPVEFPLPAGWPEGELPREPFVLAAPLAGWASKQWPLENYGVLARLLAAAGSRLVLNGPPSARDLLASVPAAFVHVSSVGGLIDGIRRAAAVAGVDSGPLHLAAALGKRGVALFGPTDPARNGPYGSSFAVLRSPRAVTTYKRGVSIDPSMHDIRPEQVFAALRERLP